jgi:hypothetical protein
MNHKSLKYLSNRYIHGYLESVMKIGNTSVFTLVDKTQSIKLSVSAELLSKFEELIVGEVWSSFEKLRTIFLHVFQYLDLDNLHLQDAVVG